MNNDIKDTLEKAAAYVAATQPELDKMAAAKQAWSSQADRTAAVLANRGVLDAEKRDAFVDKVASDPTYALIFMEKMANIIGSDNLGKPSKITKIASDETDGFTRELFPEIITNTGTID